MLQIPSAVAASQQFVVVTFKSEFTVKKQHKVKIYKSQFGNFMSNIVGFALKLSPWLMRIGYNQNRICATS